MDELSSDKLFKICSKITMGLSLSETQEVDPIKIFQFKSILDFTRSRKHSSLKKCIMDTFFKKQ